jgi:uncharacterized protein involved in response to NO
MNSAFLSVGFRPFYLAAAILAALYIPFWAVIFLGGYSTSLPSNPLAWHSHEMVFGFAPAVIVGFLLTAVRNWTGLATPSGPALAALVGLWLVGRVLTFTEGGWITVLVDGSFLPIVAAILAVPILRARNHRNIFVVGLLLLLATANLIYHASMQGWLTSLPPLAVPKLALDLILILMIVIGGRVIPAFSANAVAGLTPRRWQFLEIAAIAGPLFLLLADAGLLPTDQLLIWVLWASALVHGLRLLGWQPWKTWRQPLLLALPVAYAWIPIHFLLRAEFPTLATHALTIGAMGGLMLAMMTRSALGHTGRPLAARPVECVCFLAVHGAALSRILASAADSATYPFWIGVSAGLWTLAFGLFAIAYFPILTRPRIGQSSM